VKETVTQTRGKSEAFINYLIDLGATQQQRTLITKKLEEILTKAEIKFDDVLDFVEPMRKLEYKLKKIFNEYKVEDMNEKVTKRPDDRQFEALLKQCENYRGEQRTIRRNLEDKEKDERMKELMRLKNEKKNNMVRN